MKLSSISFKILSQDIFLEEKNVFTKGGGAQMFGLLEKMCEIWLTDDHFCLSMGGHQEAQDLACISLGAQVITV